MEFRRVLFRSKKVVVGGDAGRGNESAHGKGVDQVVIKILIFVDVGGENFADAAGGRFLILGSRENGLGPLQSGWVEAEVIFSGGANPGFGVDGSGKMIVEIGALRHLEKQIA